MENKLAFFENIVPDSNYIAIIEPGLGGYKEMSYVKSIENAMVKNNISIFSIDPYDSLGESSGNFENATFDSHLKSLKDAIAIVKKKYPSKKIIIVGHSVSAMVVLYYATDNNDIDYVVSIAPLVSGEIYDDPKDPDKKKEMQGWKKEGFRLKHGIDGKEYKVSYNFVKSLKKIDLMEKVNKITVPILLIANEKDQTTDLSDLKKLFLKINPKSDFNVIKDAPHLIKDEQNLNDLENAIVGFFKNL